MTIQRNKGAQKAAINPNSRHGRNCKEVFQADARRAEFLRARIITAKATSRVSASS